MIAGSLISFEGIDGAGKSTQIQMLEHEFNKLGGEYKTFSEPGGTELSEKIRAILLDKENIELIKTVSGEYKVDPFIIVTIAGIESNYGSHHSQYSVFNSLYSQIHDMPKRAKWASKELAEFIKYCYNDQLDPQEIGGSYAGAFGFGQFIPSSFNNFSVDFNEDGVRQPYDWPDVLASIANYLRRNGYNPNSNNYDRDGDIWKSIYAYNHADNYVMAVLELKNEIKNQTLTEGSTRN